ncbi:hypothetical protein GN956_G13969 [Arapaima gigas]
MEEKVAKNLAQSLGHKGGWGHMWADAAMDTFSPDCMLLSLKRRTERTWRMPQAGATDLYPSEGTDRHVPSCFSFRGTREMNNAKVKILSTRRSTKGRSRSNRSAAQACGCTCAWGKGSPVDPGAEAEALMLACPEGGGHCVDMVMLDFEADPHGTASLRSSANTTHTYTSAVSLSITRTSF